MNRGIQWKPATTKLLRINTSSLLRMEQSHPRNQIKDEGFPKESASVMRRRMNQMRASVNGITSSHQLKSLTTNQSRRLETVLLPTTPTSSSNNRIATGSSHVPKEKQDRLDILAILNIGVGAPLLFPVLLPAIRVIPYKS